jgi:hypothetical protein
MKLEFAKDGKWVSLAQIILNVIKLSRVDQVSYGRTRQCASQWLMLGLFVKLTMIASQETFAGP